MILYAYYMKYLFILNVFQVYLCVDKIIEFQERLEWSETHDSIKTF